MLRVLLFQIWTFLVLSYEVQLQGESEEISSEILAASELLVSLRTEDENPTPIILWHCMGDRYNSYFSM